MKADQRNLKLIGRREFVNFPLLNIKHIEAKVDTGAYTGALHCKYIELKNLNNKQVLVITLPNNLTYHFEDFLLKKIKNSFGEMEERYVIKTIIVLGGKKINTSISLSDRANMRYPVLIGRRLLKGKFLVNVDLIYTNGINTY
jgi:hypothetical protein